MNRDDSIIFNMLTFVKANGFAYSFSFPELSSDSAKWHFHYLIHNRLVTYVISITDRDDDEYIINGLTTAGNMLLLEGCE